MTAADAPAWDALVARHPDGTFCHRSGWKRVQEEGAGHRSPFLIAEDAGEIVGIMPLTLRNSALFGRAAMSSMFGVYGGALAVSADAYAALEDRAWTMAQDWGTDVLECRTIEARHKGQPGWRVPDPKSATFRRALESNEDALLKAIPRKQRAVVRKALEGDLTSDWSRDLEAFYALYARSVHSLGTPVFPKRMFRVMVEVFAPDIDVQIVRNGAGHAVASLISFYDATTVLPYYAGSGLGARESHAHDFMYFDLMKRAAVRGCTVFDFGRSKMGSGPYAFKKNWGFEPTPLEYEYRLGEGAEVPDLSPTSGKYALMVAVWKRLPLWLANRLGPPVARHLG